MKLELNEVSPTNCPMEVSKLVGLIEDTFKQESEGSPEDTGNSSNNGSERLLAQQQDSFVRHLLQELYNYSSLYKYIVHLTVVSSCGEGETGSTGGKYSVSNTVAASWNQSKDGLFNHTLRDDSTGKVYLVTVIWVYK